MILERVRKFLYQQKNNNVAEYNYWV